MRLTMQSASWLELTPDNEVIEYEDLLHEQDMALEAMLLDQDDLADIYGEAALIRAGEDI